MPYDFVSNDSIDPVANQFGEHYPSLEGDNNSQYCDSNYFKASLVRSSHKHFSFIHLNIDSVWADGDNLLSFLSSLDYRFGVICLSEKTKARRKTWLLIS